MRVRKFFGQLESVHMEVGDPGEVSRVPHMQPRGRGVRSKMQSLRR